MQGADEPYDHQKDLTKRHNSSSSTRGGAAALLPHHLSLFFFLSVGLKKLLHSLAVLLLLYRILGSEFIAAAAHFSIVYQGSMGTLFPAPIWHLLAGPLLLQCILPCLMCALAWKN